jgi:hypothetical protein
MPTRGAFFVLFLLLGSALGCASSDERLWYKPGGNYTTAEFNQDRDACTRGKKLDEECLKAKGWVTVSPDRPTPTAPPPRGGRN